MTTPVVTVVDPTYVANAIATALGNHPNWIILTFGVNGSVPTSLTGQLAQPLPAAASLFGVALSAGLGGLGTGLPIIVDLKKNTVSCSSTPNRPTLAVGAQTSFTPASNFSTTSFAALTDLVSFDIDGAGGSALGLTISAFFKAV